MTTTKTHKVGFVITGEFMTRQAIEFALYEDDWETGYRFLLDNVHGINHDDVISILRGDKKMIGQAGRGENTLDLVDTTPEEKAAIKERENYLWAGVIKFRPDYWRPYAVVDNWGPNDVGAAERYNNIRYTGGGSIIPIDSPGTVAEFRKWSASRCVEYMDDPQKDRVEYLTIDGESSVVLFGCVGNPPIWIDPLPSRTGCWEQAVKDYEEHCGPLPVRGHDQKFRWFNEAYGPKRTNEEIEEGEERLRETNDKIVNRFKGEDDDDLDDTVERKIKSDLLQSMMGTGLLAPEHIEAAAGTLEAIFGSEDDDTPPIPEDFPAKDYGWILRNGDFYACLFHKHADLARRIWKFVEKTTDEDKLNDPQKAGDKAGWVRLSKSLIDSEPYYHCEKRITNAQQKTLEEWAHLHSLDLNDVRQSE